MPRKTTKLTAEERRAATAPSLPLDDPPEAVVVPDDGEVATRVVWSEPGPEGAVVRAHEDHGPPGVIAPAVVGGNPAPEAVPSHYQVVHAAVGGHYKGERVEAGAFTDEQSGRLLTAGAIIPFYKAD